MIEGMPGPDLLPELPGTIAFRWLEEDLLRRHSAGEWLTEEERRRMASFGSDKRRREFALGRLAGRSLLAERLGVEPCAVPMRVADDGAPEVPGALHLSIAHSLPYAAAAVAPHPVGVDLERIAPRRSDLYRFVLHPEEYGLVEALPFDHDRVQILAWTLKEAVLKGLRTGFRLSPKKLHLEIDPERGSARVRVKGGRVWTAHFVERSGFFYAVAYEARNEGGDHRNG